MSRSSSNNNYFPDDEILGKAYDSRLMRRFVKYILPYKWPVFVSFFFLLLNRALMLAFPLFLKYVIDTFITSPGPASAEGIRSAGILLLVIIAGQVLTRYAQIYITFYVGQKVMYDLRREIFAHLQKLSLSYFDKTPVGRLVTRVTSDVQSLNQLLTAGVVAVLGDILALTVVLAIMFSLDVKLTLAILSLTPIILFASFVFRLKARSAYRDVRKYLAKINAFMQENITGMRVVQTFNRQGKNLGMFKEVNEEHFHAHLRSIFYMALFFPVMNIIISSTFALVIWYGGGQVFLGALSIGAFIAFIQYVQHFIGPIQQLAEKYNIFQSAMASSERIFKLLDTKPVITNPENPKSLTDVAGNVEFKDVWFAYNEGEWILKNVSFDVKQGQSVAIVGATGAGKTSIINLLTRFYDIQKGTICIDRTSIKDVDMGELRSQIGVVLQDVFIFSGDISRNIRLLNENITDEQIEQCAKYVNASKFIETLPGKYYAETKERGATLSSGQRQLIAFARALAFNPKILVLDEATSSIDTETELLIQDALQKLMKGRTSIIIAHRLSTIKNVDKIILLHKGEIAETGTHQELLAKKGLYHKLYQFQYQAQERKNGNK